jgi:sec-independent protein translocase protein TatA
MPFNLGPMEILLFLVLALVLFGAKRLPELGSGLGKGIREFKRSMHEIKADVDLNDERREIHPGQRAAPSVSAGPVESSVARNTSDSTTPLDR